MKFSLLILLAIPLSLVSCKTEHHVSNDSLNRTRIGDTKMLEEKFAGNWKPEDAAWYSAPGETDPKKLKERESSVKRSQFESVVSKSRSKVDEHGTSQWDKRANYEKEWAGTKEKKTFKWPWQKPDVKPKDSGLTKEYAGQKDAREDSRIAREGDETARDNSKTFGTSDYVNREPEIKKKEQWQAANPDVHKELKIIEDRSEAKDESNWSITDIRKFLNKH